MNPDVTIFLGVFAAIGMVLKATILFNVEIKSKAAECFVILCLLFVLQNTAEFLGYFTYLRSVAIGEFFLHSYMIVSYFVFPSILILALALANSPRLPLARTILYSISALISLAYFQGWVVTGVEFIGWSAITVAGPLNWVSVLYILLCAIITVAYLARQMLTNLDYEVRYNCKINLIAFIPLLLVAFAVLLLRVAGFNSSSSMSVPIASLAFLFVMLLHTNGNLFWLSTKLKSVLAVLKMDKHAPIDAIIKEIEKVRIQEALKLTSGQQKTAAEILGLPASTLNKRITKYSIDINGYK